MAFFYRTVGYGLLEHFLARRRARRNARRRKPRRGLLRRLFG